MAALSKKMAETTGHLYWRNPKPLLPDPRFAPDYSYTTGDVGPIDGKWNNELRVHLASFDHLVELFYRIELEHPGKAGHETCGTFHRQIREAFRRYGLGMANYNSALFQARLCAGDFLNARWAEKLARDKAEAPSG